MPAEQCQEKIWHGLPPMPGGGDPVGGGVQLTDDGRGPFLPVAVEGISAV